MGAQHIGRRRHAGARQMMVDLLAHLARGLLDQTAEFVFLRAGFVGKDAERRLQRMGKIADMGPRAFQHFPIAVQQAVQFLGQRFDLARELAFQPRRPAGADIRKRQTHPVQRLQAETHLNEKRAQQHDAEHTHGGGDPSIEMGDIPFQFRAVGGHCEGHRHIISGQRDTPLQHAQMLAFRPGRPECLDAVLAALDFLARIDIELLVEEGARTQGRARGQRGDLPIKARIGEIEAAFAQLARAFQLAVGRDIGTGDEAVQHGGKARIEAALDRAPEQCGENDPARHEDDGTPEGRACDEAEREAARPHLPVPSGGSRGPARSRSDPCRACGAGGPRTLRSCSNPGRNPGRRDVRPVRSAR